MPRLLPAQWTCSQASSSSVVRLSHVTTPLTELTKWRYLAKVTAGATVRERLDTLGRFLELVREEAPAGG